jgi:alanine-glyoxylate transaminase/serine-glyoxylate transaminase/serine-pyruvate transaminase
MSVLPSTNRILLGPGPSLTSPRVMRAMASPTVSHLDPLMLVLLDEVRARLGRVFGAPDGSFAFAVSGTGTAGMEASVANLVREGTRVLVVVTGYFGDRLAGMCERYGATLARLDVPWGRACDPEALERALRAAPVDLVAMVHVETSTGVLNPVREMAAIAREHGALVLVDAVTSFGGHELDAGEWGIDACYSCTQKCLGAPSGLAPVMFGPRAIERRVPCRSFYFDLSLLQEYWLNRKYHHTMSSALVCALAEALAVVEACLPGGRDTSGTTWRSPAGWRRSGSASFRLRENGRGRSTPCGCRRASTRPSCAGTCSSSSASRLAPGLDPSPAASGESG